MIVEPIRLKIDITVYEKDLDVRHDIRDGPYRIKDSVSISKEAMERFEASQNGQLLIDQSAQGGIGDEQDPELKKNLETLDLNLGARPEQIRKAYLEAVKKYHPDKFMDSSPELAKVAEEKTKEVNYAYSALRKV